LPLLLGADSADADRGQQKPGLIPAKRLGLTPAKRRTWCKMAGYQPEVVRKRAQHVYENGLARQRAKRATGVRYASTKAYRERLKARRVDT
jgi:hypothetical protein